MYREVFYSSLLCMGYFFKAPSLYIFQFRYVFAYDICDWIDKFLFYKIYFLAAIHISKFFLYLYFAWVIIPQSCGSMCVWIDMFWHIIYMFSEIGLSTLHIPLLVCTSFWEGFNIYFLYLSYSATVSPYSLAIIHASSLMFLLESTIYLLNSLKHIS